MSAVSLSELRELVLTQANWRCEWPHCDQPAVELAHLHSRGMGGSRHQNTEGNTMAACRTHARYTDGQPDGDLTAYRLEIERLLGVPPGPGTAYRLAEYLTDHLTRLRGETR